MQNQVMTPFTMNAVLLGIKTQLTTGGACKVKLFQNDYVPTPASVLAAFTEATFDGYAAIGCGYNIGPDREPDGSFSIWAPTNFVMTGATTPNIIYGAYVTDFAGTNLLFATRFDVQQPMVDAFSHLYLTNKITLPVNGLVNGSIVLP